MQMKQLKQAEEEQRSMLSRENTTSDSTTATNDNNNNESDQEYSAADLQIHQLLTKEEWLHQKKHWLKDF